MKPLLLLIYLFTLQVSPLIIMDLPEGELAWSTERPKDAKMCIPAAFTDLEGNVEGEYRLNGKIFNPNKRLKVSIGNGTFYIDRSGIPIMASSSSPSCIMIGPEPLRTAGSSLDGPYVRRVTKSFSSNPATG